jgi:hypothetical protein
MDRDAFATLQKLIDPLLSQIHKDVKQACRGSGSRVLIKTKLVILHPFFYSLWGFFAFLIDSSSCRC